MSFSSYTKLNSADNLIKSAVSNREVLERITGYSRIFSVGVTAERALQVPVVNGGLRVLSETMAAVPCFLYRREGEDGRLRAKDKRLYKILHNLVNDEMTAFEWKRASIYQLYLRGNTYSLVTRSSIDKEVLGLRLLQAQYMTVETRGGETVYRYNDPNLPHLRTDDMDKDDLFIVRNMSEDGMFGRSLLDYGRTAVAFLIAAEKYGGSFFENYAKPTVLLVHPGQLSPDAQDRLERNFIEKYTGSQRHGVHVLQEGMDVKELQMPNDKAQLLELRTFQVQELARVLRLSPTELMDFSRATFSNITELSLQFVSRTLLPIAINFEHSVYRDLLLPEDRDDYFVEFLFDVLVKGDLEKRYVAYSRAIHSGFLLRNEARARENLNPIPGGDDPLVPANLDTVEERLQELEEQLNRNN